MGRTPVNGWQCFNSLCPARSHHMHAASHEMQGWDVCEILEATSECQAFKFKVYEGRGCDAQGCMEAPTDTTSLAESLGSRLTC